MRYCYVLVLVLSIIVPTIQCVDWANLTAVELSWLSPSEFLNITAQELGSIPAPAMKSLSSEQIKMIPFSEASGFTEDQLSNIGPFECGGFNESHILYITPQAFGGFSYRCIDQWTQQVFNAISKDQVSHFSNSICWDISVKRIWWLKTDAISGFTAECVKSLQYCDGFNSTLFSLLSPDAISGLDIISFAQAPHDIFSLASAVQMSNLSPTICAALDSTYITHINYNAVSGLTPQCVVNLTANACQAMNGTWLSHMALDSVTALTAQCIASVPPSSDLQLLNGDFFHALDPLSCSSWSAAQSMYFTAKAASGITPQCLGNFTTQRPGGACSGLTAGFISGLSATSFNAFTEDCIHSVAPSAFKDITRDQLQGINSALCSAFSLEQVSMFPSTAGSGMQAQCLEQLTASNHGACAGLQGEFVAHMKPATFKGLTAECVRPMYSTIFSLISAQQVENIPVTTFSALSDTQIDALTNDAIQGATLEQLKHVSNSGFDGFTMAHLVIIIRKYGLDLVPAWTVEQTRTSKVYEISHFKDLVNKDNFAKLVSWDDFSSNVSRATWVMIALLKDDPKPRLDSKVIQALAPSAIAGLRAYHIELIAGKDFEAFTPLQGLWFTDDQVSVFTAAQLRNMAAKTFGALNFMVISSLPAELISALSIEKVQELPALNIEYMTCDQLKSFNRDQTSYFNLEQQVAYDTTSKQCKNGDLLIPMTENEPYSEATTIVLLTMAGVIVVTFIIAVIIWGVQRRRRAAEENIESDERKPLVEFSS